MTLRTFGLACAAVLGLACAGVLGLSRPGPAPFPHRRHAVAGIACTRCHAPTSTTAPLAIPDDASCTACHTKPHDTRSCLSCHSAPGALAALAEARDHLVFDHRSHPSDNCMRCHTGIADGDDRLRPAMATCFKCHADLPDRGADRGADRAGDRGGARSGLDARRCDACHRDLETSAPPASHLAHDGDWLREHGVRAGSSGDVCSTCHAASYCASCHGVTAPALPATRRFADPFAASVHRAGFAARHSLEARSSPGSCSTCHSPDRCATCHTARGVAERASGSPHPANWIGLTPATDRHGREARRDPASCASCHSGAGESLCVKCHAVGGVGGNPHPPGWSSRLPLTALPCRLCHPVGSQRSAR